jgi:hypothetical protein
METTVTKEPTRDPRLLSADQIAIAFHLLREVHPQVTEVVKAHIAALEAELQSRVEEAEDRANELANRLAAQDQRHAALRGLVTDVRAILDMWHQKGNQHEYVVAWMEGLARRIKEIQAAQPPGDERRGGK